MQARDNVMVGFSNSGARSDDGDVAVEFVLLYATNDDVLLPPW